MLWASSFFNDMYNYLTDKDKVRGEPTLVEGFDELLGGGKREGELTVTLAEAKTGKNTFWHKLMHLWLKKGMALAYASRELSPETEVLPNLLSLEKNTNYWLQEDYDPELDKAIVSSWKLLFSKGYGSLPKEELFEWMDMARSAGIKWFWIDHLHYCLEDPEDFKLISVFARELKAYAKKHSIHIDLIVQPKVQDPGTRLSLNSLRGGAAIGQALDNLVTMTRVRDEAGKLTSVVKVTLEVARSKLARLGDFYLSYDRHTTNMVEVVPDNDGPTRGKQIDE